MIAGFFCTTYCLVILLLQGEDPFPGFTFVLPILFASGWWYAFRVFQFQKTFILINIFTGATAGIIYALYIFTTYYAPLETGIKYQGSIIQTSAKSFVVEGSIKNKIFRARLRHKVEPGQKLFKGQKLIFTCNTWANFKSASTFQNLESLQGVYGFCSDSQVKFLPVPETTFHRWRVNIRTFIQTRLANLDEYTYAPGFILADTSGLHPRELYLLRRMGVAHLFSASGLHLGLLFGFFLFLFRYKPVASAGILIGFLACAGYVALLDFRLSLLRAFLFLSLYLLTKILDRKVHSITLLFLTGAALEIMVPLSSFSPSFILSFSVTFSILYFYPKLKKIIMLKNEYLRDHTSVSLSATIASAFAGSWLFSYFNVLSVLYNLYLVPFAAVYLISVKLYIIFPELKFLIDAGDSIIRWSVKFHSWMWESNFPQINSETVYIWLAIVLVFLTIAVILFIKNETWKVYRRFTLVGLFLFSSFFLSVNWRSYPQQAIYPFVTGVIVYDHKNIYIGGKPATFSIEKIDRTLGNFSYPYNSIYSEKPFAKVLSESLLLPGEQPEFLKMPQKAGVFMYENYCVVFLSNASPEYWSRHTFKSCNHLRIVVSKKFNDTNENRTEWTDFFSMFGEFESVKYIGYFRWYIEEG
ncbi:MAG: ComEC/Rec2 family competence protein [Leptospirales bacterium]